MTSNRAALPAAIAIATIACVLVTGCVPASAPPPIPPIPAERIPAPPASTKTLIWQPGHYDWDGERFVFINGQWIPRSGHSQLWQDGTWVRSGTGWTWSSAHWL